LVRGYDHFKCTGLSVPPAVFTWVVNVEVVVCMLDYGDPQAAKSESTYQLLDQSGFARS
jgi:hypothetical protein